MKVTRKFIFRFLQSEYDFHKHNAQKYAQLMSCAERAQDPIAYRKAEFNWWRCEHSADAIQSFIYRLKNFIEEGEKP